MLLDSGIVRIYGVTRKLMDGVTEDVLTLRCEAWYGDINTGVMEWYEGSAHQAKPEGRIRIWQNRSVSAGDIVVMPDGRQYEISRSNHTQEAFAQRRRESDPSGLPVTDITLKLPGKTYTIPRRRQSGVKRKVPGKRPE